MSPISRPLSRRRFVTTAGVAAFATVASPYVVRAADPGTLVVYSTTFPSVQRQLGEVFKRNTGIEVRSLRLSSSPLAQRFITEQKAQQFTCDILTLGDAIFFHDISKAGLLADIDDIPNVSNLPATWRPGKRFVRILIGPHSIGYNTNLVTGALIPTGWLDMLKPEFTNQIILADPRANEYVILFFTMLRDTFGDDYLRKLGEQKPRWVPNVPQAVDRIIGGEAEIYMPALAMNLIQYEGSNPPTAIIPTPTPTNGTNFFCGIVGNAPNKVGARKWYEFILSEEGQEILAHENGISPLGDIPGSLKMPEKFVEPDLATALKNAARLYDLLGLSA
jgi:iron(III) transport system substrate-binding protein